MEVVPKPEPASMGTPMPQRNIKNNQSPNVKLETECIAEKKPRFNPPNGNFQGGNNNRGGGPMRQNNRQNNRNMRGGMAHGRNQNQNQNQMQNQNQNQNQNVANDNDVIVVSGGQGNEQQQQQQPKQGIDQQQPQQSNDQKQNNRNAGDTNQMQNSHYRRGGGNEQRGGGGGGGGSNFERRSGANMDRRGGGGGPNGGRSEEFFVYRRLENLVGPTYDLPAIEHEETKFSGRNRLYIGNLTGEVNEKELRELFKPYGEIGEVFANSEKNFAFLKVDFHTNAEKAKRELDGLVRKGRTLRVRFAPNATILRVKNLTPFVSNELLFKSFEIFGPIERAVIIVDDRGKHTGEGIVEFAKKSSAMTALRLCEIKCFFLTSSLRPCVVEPFDINDDTDGMPDKSMNKKAPEFHHERKIGPRFADLKSFEHEYGSRWKQLHELYKTKQDALKRELQMEEDKLEAQMEIARYEHETELLRQELRKREQDNERKKAEWELREKQAEELKLREEEQMRRQQNEMQMRMSRQEEEMRRRQQENTLFMQAQQLNSLLDQHENNHSNHFDPQGNQNSFDFRGGNKNNMGGNNQQDFDFNVFDFGNNLQNQNHQGNNQQGGGGGGGNGNKNNQWERRNDFQNKRRRF